MKNTQTKHLVAIRLPPDVVEKLKENKHTSQAVQIEQALRKVWKQQKIAEKLKLNRVEELREDNPDIDFRVV